MTPKVPTVVDAREAARYLSLSPSTLAKMRVFGKGPQFCKLGRRVVYRLSDLDDYLDASRRSSTSKVSGDEVA